MNVPKAWAWLRLTTILNWLVQHLLLSVVSPLPPSPLSSLPHDGTPARMV
ncbi:hypothetical protein BH11GEM1_BH11GEM1_08770 [soil metagenome]